MTEHQLTAITLVSAKDPTHTQKQLRQRELLKVTRQVVESAARHSTKPRSATAAPLVRYIVSDTLFLRLQEVIKGMKED